jgi:UDP-2,4-diacetamido-2,4,6-trideoxy-beta-L-altropyranose hydrolase
MTDAAERMVLFRTTGGRLTGFGHARRCLSLAQALRQVGMRSEFVLDDASLEMLVAAQGFACVHVDAASDLATTLRLVRECRAMAVVVDSYTLPPSYVHDIRVGGAAIAVIDDLRNAELEADVIVNPSPATRRQDYARLAGAMCLLGPSYALLRPQFARCPTHVVREHVERVLITLGGSDPSGLTKKILSCVRDALPRASVDVVLGPLADESSLIEAVAQDPDEHVSVYRDPTDMADLMLAADLAMSAGGQTLYELAATGTPTAAIRLVDNQTGNLLAFAHHGTLSWAGDAGNRDLSTKLAHSLRLLDSDRDWRQQQSLAGQRLVDGQGAGRVANEILRIARARLSAA